MWRVEREDSQTDGVGNQPKKNARQWSGIENRMQIRAPATKLASNKKSVDLKVVYFMTVTWRPP